MDNNEKECLIKKKKISKENIILIIIAIMIILIDQVSKLYMTNFQEITVIPNILKFSIVQNDSAAYGIGSNSKAMYLLTNIVILGVVFKFITTQNEFIDRKTKVFLNLILAGGLSNLIDKLFRGYVVEFVNFKDLINIPVFNTADLSILIGWVSIAAVFAVFTVKEWQNKKTNNKIKDDDKKKD